MLMMEIDRVLPGVVGLLGIFGFWSGVVIFGDNQSGRIIACLV